jgi:hypothetical protein
MRLIVASRPAAASFSLYWSSDFVGSSYDKASENATTAEAADFASKSRSCSRSEHQPDPRKANRQNHSGVGQTRRMHDGRHSTARWHGIRGGPCFTARMEATALIRTLRELGQLKLKEKDFHALSVICDKIDIRRDDRNLITHGTWGREAGQIEGYALSLRIKGDPSEIVSETFSYRRMREIIADIITQKWDLIRLLKMDALPGMPAARPPSS